MEESKQSGNVTGLLAQNRNSIGKGKKQKLKIREEIFSLKRLDLRAGQRTMHDSRKQTENMKILHAEIFRTKRENSAEEFQSITAQQTQAHLRVS
jgi:hypothetical protein